jgi:hypothetical protein
LVSSALTAALGEIAVAILVAAAAVHVFWALGGKWGKDLAIPTKPGGAGPAMRPRAPATLMVATALAVAADLVAVRIGLLTSALPAWLVHAATVMLTLAFLARAIGDRRYVGFFKRVKGSRFARLDTAFYSPLCLFLAVAVGVNAW